MIVTIKKVEDSSKNDRVWKTIYYDKDGAEKKKPVFDAKFYPLLVPGATVELDLKKNGEYWDVMDIRPSTAQAAVSADKSGTFAESNIRQKSIEAQNALNNATELVIAFFKDKLPDLTFPQEVNKVLDTRDWLLLGAAAVEPEKQPEIKDEELFPEPEKFSIKTQADYEAAVKDLGGKLGFKKMSDFNAFLNRNIEMLGSTAWKAYDDSLKIMLISLLQKEVENKGV